MQASSNKPSAGARRITHAQALLGSKGEIACYLAVLALSLLASVAAEAKPRARDWGVPFDGTPGPLNAITDVRGVEVGHTTLISGEGALKVGEGPVRTGVTAVLPRGKSSRDPVFAGWFTLNGNGEMTGTTWVEENGFLEGPVMITNTHSVGVVRDSVIAWRLKHGGPDKEGYAWSYPSSRRPGTDISTTPMASTSSRSTYFTPSTARTAVQSRKAMSAAAPA